VARLPAGTSKGGGTEALTLDEVAVRAWQALNAWETAQCPCCGGEMRRGGEAAFGSRAEEAEPEGECEDCGTRLS
jgi:hypothetical protein